MKYNILKFITAAILISISLPSLAENVCVGISPEPGKFVGPVYCGAGTIDTLSIRGGPVVMNGTTINGASDIAGPLSAKDTFFKSSLFIASDTLTLDSSQAADIDIKSTSLVQSVYLKNSSGVSGNIKFEGKNGVVYVSGGSKITDSQVIGGKVVRE